MRSDLPRRLDLVVLALTVSLWSLSLVLSAANDYSINPPLIFWAVLALAAVSTLLVPEEHLSLQIICLIFLALVVQFTPSFIESNARVYDSYIHYGLSNAIVEAGRTDPSTFFYDSWPGAYLVGAFATELSGMPPEIFLRVFPAFFLIAVSAGLVAVINNLSKVSRTFASSPLAKAGFFIIFFAENNSLQSHFSPQSLGLILVVIWFFLVTKRRIANFGSNAVILLLIMISIVVTHPPSALFVGFAMVSAMVLRGLRKAWYSGPATVSLSVLFWISFFAWQVYEANAFPVYLGDLIVIVTGILANGVIELSRLVVGTPSNPTLGFFSIARHIFFFCLALIGFSIMVKKRDRSVSSILIFASGTALLFLMFVITIGGLLWDRVLLYGALPVSVCAAYVLIQNWKRARILLLAFSLVFLLVGTYTLYAGEEMRIVPQTEFASANFVVSKIRALSTTTYSDEIILFLNPYYSSKMVSPVSPEQFKLADFTHPSPSIAFIILSGRTEVQIGAEQYAQLEFQMLAHTNIIYASGFIHIYGIPART
jgi:hypothetical protein